MIVIESLTIKGRKLVGYFTGPVVGITLNISRIKSSSSSGEYSDHFLFFNSIADGSSALALKLTPSCFTEVDLVVGVRMDLVVSKGGVTTLLVEEVLVASPSDIQDLAGDARLLHLYTPKFCRRKTQIEEICQQV